VRLFLFHLRPSLRGRKDQVLIPLMESLRWWWWCRGKKEEGLPWLLRPSVLVEQGSEEEKKKRKKEKEKENGRRFWSDRIFRISLVMRCRHAVGSVKEPGSCPETAWRASGSFPGGFGVRSFGSPSLLIVVLLRLRLQLQHLLLQLLLLLLPILSQDGKGIVQCD